LLVQLGEAKEAHRLHERTKEAVEESRNLVRGGNFAEARRVIWKLPDMTEEIKSLKANLLKQIDEAEEVAGLNARIENTLNEAKALVGKGKFDVARKAIRALPDNSDELCKLKTDVLRQVGEAERAWTEVLNENAKILSRLASR